MASAFEFARRLNVIGEKIGQAPGVIKRKVALQVLNAVTLGTPVDTGQHRGAWGVAIGAPFAGETPLDPGGQTTIAKGEGVILSAPEGEAIHITNNAPAIIPLNDGHSKQQPAKFVERAVAEGVASIQGVRILS